MADQTQQPESIVGGLMGLRDPDLLLNVGLGLMSAARYGGNVGSGLQEAIGNYQHQKLAQQQIRMGQIQNSIMQSQLPIIKSVSDSLQGGGQPQGPMLASTGNPQAAVGPQGAAPPQQGNALAMPQGLMGDGGRNMQLGALLDLAGMKGGGLTELGKTQLQYNPQIAQNMKAAQDELAIALHNRDQALQQGDQSTAQMWHQKALTLSGLLKVSDRNGNITAFTGGMGANGLPNFVGFNPDTGIQSSNQGAGGIPGFAGAKGAIAGAEARARAQYEPMMLSDKEGNEYPVSKSALPALTGSGAMSKIGPATSTMLTGKSTHALQTNQGFQDQAEAAQQMLQQTATLRSSAADFSPGQFASSRIKTLQWLDSMGLISPDQAKSLGSAQAGQKIAIQLQAAATKQLGSREAAQIFQIMGKSLPNLELSKDGLDKVSGYMDGIARYNIARAQKAQTAVNANDPNAANNVRDDFIKNSNPLYYIIASMPPKVQQQELANMGDKRQAFLDSWKKAVQAGYAPRPSGYGIGAAQ